MIDNIKKAINYMRRNGIENTLYASAERLIGDDSIGPYSYSPISEKEMLRQKNRRFPASILFSIVMPTYNTAEEYLREAIESVLNQTYGNLELIIADASEGNSVGETVCSYRDSRIRFLKLKGNKGISSNTNSAIMAARGEYIGFLDHDDMLTPDCLYENALMLAKARDDGIEYAFIYSDEDKCDSNGKRFFEPHIKNDFDPDLLLTNNYVCHFLVTKASLAKKLMLRGSFDGAQDHDFVIRIYGATSERSYFHRIEYGHIPKVLYHWRCHKGSTSLNPECKDYAYDSGKRAIEEYLKSSRISGEVVHLKHKGFFRINYSDPYVYEAGSSREMKMRQFTATARGRLAYNTFLNRYDIGAIGGPVYEKNKISGGLIDSHKSFAYSGLYRRFDGYMHRAGLQQQGLAVDVRNMVISDSLVRCFVGVTRRKEFVHLFRHDTVKELEQKEFRDLLDAPFVEVRDYLSTLEYDGYEYLKVSVALGEAIRLEGFISYYDPYFLLEEDGEV